MRIPGALIPYRFRRVSLEIVVALCLAFLAWLYTRSRDQEILDQVPIPVQIQLAPAFASNYDLETGGTGRVAVSFAGPPSRIRELRRKLQRGLVQVSLKINVPDELMNEASFRDSVHVAANDVPVPPGVMAVVADESAMIPYTVRRLVERHLPVRLDYAGESRITQVKVEPATVVVRGPKDILDRLWSISTQPYFLPSSPEENAGNALIRGQTAVITELEGRPLQTTPKTVAFSFKVRPRQKTYELTGVPVHFLFPANFPWRAGFAGDQPGKVNLRVQGPASEEPPPVTAFVDLTGATFRRGRNLEPVRLQLPKDFQLAQDTAPLVGFTLEAIEAAAEETRGEPE